MGVNASGEVTDVKSTITINGEHLGDKVSIECKSPDIIPDMEKLILQNLDNEKRGEKWIFRGNVGDSPFGGKSVLLSCDHEPKQFSTK
jgi:hypothetical protein